MKQIVFKLLGLNLLALIIGFSYKAFLSFLAEHELLL